MRRIGFVLSVLVGASALPALSQTIALSGTVKDAVTGNGLSGAKVSLATTKDSTTTGTGGSWSIDHSVTTGLGLRSGSSKAVSGHLSLQDGHVVLRFDGHDALGHGARSVSAPYAPTAALARSSGIVVDTLLVSWKDSIRVRYPLTSYSATGLQLTFDTLSFVLDTGHFTDVRDGQSYKYTKIGSQTWMAQNLNYKRSGSDSGRCYNNDTSNCSTYGRLYTWSEVMDTSSTYDTTFLKADLPHQGICPSGWHVPSDAEWSTLIQYADPTVSGTRLMANSSLWRPWNLIPTDVYGFSVLPAGVYILGTFSNDEETMLWLSEMSPAIASAGVIRSYQTFTSLNTYYKSYGFSLRCVKDN